MANQSIYAAFERMWQHIIAKMEAKSAAHVEYTDRAIENAWADVVMAENVKFPTNSSQF